MQIISKAKIKHINQLAQKKYRANNRQFIIEGEKIVLSALEHNQPVEYLIVREDKASSLSSLTSKSPATYSADPRTFKKISQLTTPPGVMAVVHMPAANKDIREQGRYLYLDGLSDPGNLGTIIRTADWFGLDGIFISPNTVDPYNTKTIQASMSSIFAIQPIQIELDTLRSRFPEWRIIGTDISGKEISKLGNDTTNLLVIGSESHGISASNLQLCDEIVSIGGSDKKIAESLNAGVASAILCHALFCA